MRFALAVAVLLLVPRALHADAGDDDRILSAYKALDYVHPKSAKVAKLRTPDDHRGKFFGANVASEWKPLKPEQWHAVATLVQEALEKQLQSYVGAGGDGEPVRLTPLCLPSPVYGIQLETDKGSRTVAICFACGSVDVGDKFGRAVQFYPSDDLMAELKACYRDDFGEDVPALSHKPAK